MTPTAHTILEDGRTHCSELKITLHVDGPRCNGCSAILTGYRAPTFDDLVATYRAKLAEDRRFAAAGDRTIEARAANDAAHHAGQRLLDHVATSSQLPDPATSVLRRLIEDDPHRGEHAECVHCDAGGIGCRHHKPGCPWYQAATLLGMPIEPCTVHRNEPSPTGLVDGTELRKA